MGGPIARRVGLAIALASGCRSTPRPETVEPARAVETTAQAGRLLATTSQVRLLDLRTGKDLWSRAFGDGAVVGATLADDAVYVGVRLGDKGDLVALAASDGHEVWRTGGVASRHVNAAPIASRRRVFWVDNATLRVFDRTTGAPRWSYTEDRGGPHSAQLVRDRGEILFFAGLGFDPARDLVPREVTLSGTVRLAQGAPIPGDTPLEGIEIVAGDDRAVTDASGRFTLKARGRGLVSIFFGASAWLDGHAALLAKLKRPHRFPCVDTWRDSVDLDFEKGPSRRTLTPELKVALCGWDEGGG